MNILGALWDQIIMRPIINALSLLYDGLFDELVLSIVSFTLIMRLLLMPLTLRQTRQMKRLQSIQPRVKDLQNKYKDKTPEARRRLSEETMRIYREAGVNPIGCLGPFVIQLPIWIGLYRAILRVVPTTPEGLVNLGNTFYSWNPAAEKVPFDPFFLGVDLAAFTSAALFPWNFVLPVLVGSTTWLQQKISSPATASDPRQQQTAQLMLWLMPIMLAVFSWNFPAGLAVYIFFSNLIGVIIQYFVGGRQPIALMGRMFLGTSATRTAMAATISQAKQPKEKEATSTESINDESETEIHRKNRRRSNRTRPAGTRRRSRRY